MASPASKAGRAIHAAVRRIFERRRTQEMQTYSVTIAEILVDAIASDFLTPTINRLSRQLKRNINLDVHLKLYEHKVHRKLEASRKANQQCLLGEVRIVASDSAIKGRFKYELQCIFPETEGLEDFSGVRMNGAVLTDQEEPENKYTAFAYTYNKRDWIRMLRDF